MSDRISLKELRAAAEKAYTPDTTYADVQAVWDLVGPLTLLELVEAVEAAKKLLPSLTLVDFHLEGQDELAAALARFCDYGTDNR